MTATLSTDTVNCAYYNLTLENKCLKDQTKVVHGPDAKLDFPSTASSDIRELFTEPPSNISKTSLAQLEVEQQPTLDISEDASDGSEIIQSSTILSELRSLQSKVDQLEK